MKKVTQSLLMIFIPAFVVLVPFSSAFSGTTCTSVEMETGGCIRASGTASPDCDNSVGAMFWDGSGWVVNDTYGHMYFATTCNSGCPVPCVPGAKVKDFTTTQAPCQAQGSGVEVLRETGPSGTEYRAIHNIYSYAKNRGGTEYTITAAEFVVQPVLSGTDTPTGQKVVLRSRSANATSFTPYFDVYIANEDGTTTEAFRSDPVWFHYAMGMDQALVQTDPTAYRMGEMVTLNSEFWLDVGGGSEMGGKTFKLITDSLSNGELDGLNTSFISRFAVQYTDGNDVLRQLLFCPHVYSISPSAPIPTLSQWGTVLMSVLLAALAIGFLRVRRNAA